MSYKNLENIIFRFPPVNIKIMSYILTYPKIEYNIIYRLKSLALCKDWLTKAKKIDFFSLFRHYFEMSYKNLENNIFRFPPVIIKIISYILTYPKIEYKLIYRLKNSVMQRLTNKG